MKNRMNKCHNRAALVVIIITFVATLLLTSGCSVTGELGKHYWFEQPYRVTDIGSGIVYDSVYPFLHPSGSVEFETDSSIIFISNYKLEALKQ